MAAFSERRGSTKYPQPPTDRPYRRKLIGFDEETWRALELLGRDAMKDVQELADEAFADLLEKHHRPVTLRAALEQSATAHPPQQRAVR